MEYRFPWLGALSQYGLFESRSASRPPLINEVVWAYCIRPWRQGDAIFGHAGERRSPLRQTREVVRKQSATR